LFVHVRATACFAGAGGLAGAAPEGDGAPGEPGRAQGQLAALHRRDKADMAETEAIPRTGNFICIIPIQVLQQLWPEVSEASTNT